MKTFLVAKIAALLDPSEQTAQAYKDAFGVIVGQQKPACFSESGSHVLTAMEKGFEKLLVVLSECGCSNPDRLTVFQFYTWLDYLDEKFEAQKTQTATHASKRQ